jgi:GMP synthase (glutamine-hydrolysing)
MIEQIVILDFGSQYTQVIARRIRECNVYSTILHFNTPAAEIAALKPSGIILSGGPSSVYTADAPLPDKDIFKLGVPVLGICYGVQLLAHFLGGKVENGLKREYGKGTLKVKDGRCPLFAKLPASLQVWNSHGDKLTKLPRGFKPWRSRRTPNLPRSKTAPRNSSACNSIPKSPIPRAAGRSTATSFTASAAVAGTGRCAITPSKQLRKFVRKSAKSGSSSA